MAKGSIKRANWLELFYDLIFVYAISKATHILAYTHNGHLYISQYFIFLLVFIPIWWSWTGHTLFATRFDTHQTIQRILTLIQMLAVVFWATFIDEDFDSNYIGYLFFYILIRVILILMYASVCKKYEHAGEIARRLSLGFGIGLIVATLSLFFEPPFRYFILYLGISIEIITPLLSKKILQKIPVDSHHLPERYGLLTIVLLGESVIMIASNLSNIALTYDTVSATISGFVIISSIWWIYFDLMEKYLLNSTFITGQNVIYGHLFIYIGLSVIAVFIGFSIDNKLTLTHDIMLVSVGFIFLCIGFLLTFETKALFQNMYLFFYVLVALSVLNSLLAV